MKRFWLAGICLAALTASAAAFAQTAAPAAAPSVAPAPVPVTIAPAQPVATPPATTAAVPAPVAVAPAPAGTAPAPAVAAPAPAKAGDWTNYNPYSGEESDLQNPNRTQDEIIAWSQQRATDLLSFAPADVDSKMAKVQKTFNPQGWTEYSAYLKDSKLTDMVKSQNYSVTTIVNGDIMILNSGAMAGNYHWLVELPLMVTFLHSSGVDGEAPQAVAGGNFKLILQLGRMPPAQGGVDGMAIESWKMETQAAGTP